MRGCKRDFTMSYPGERAEFEWLPPGFDMGAVVTLAHVPLDPLVVECQGCQHHHDRTCRPEAFFRRECGLVETEAPEATEREMRGSVRECIIATLQKYGPGTIYEIAALSGRKYGALKKGLPALVAEGLVIEGAGPARSQTARSCGVVKTYVLAENTSDTVGAVSPVAGASADYRVKSGR